MMKSMDMGDIIITKQNDYQNLFIQYYETFGFKDPGVHKTLKCFSDIFTSASNCNKFIHKQKKIIFYLNIKQHFYENVIR